MAFIFQMPKIQGVNFWSLTSVARRKTIHRMKLESILELSFKSNHFHEFLKHHKLPPMELEWKFNRNDWRIRLRTPSKKPHEVESVELRFPHEKDPPADEDVEFKVVKMTSYFIIKNCHSWDARLKAMGAISKNVGEIAQLKYKLHCSGDATCDIFETFVFQTTESFSRVVLGEGRLTDSRSFTKEQIRFLVEHLDTEDLYLRCSLKEIGMVKNVKLNQKKLELDNCEWMSPMELLNNTRLEEVTAHFMRPCDLSHFVRIADDWQKGTGFHNLKRMDIQANPWSRQKRLRVQEDGKLGLVRSDDENFQDFSGTIKRLSDGKMAKVKAFICLKRRQGAAAIVGVGIFKLIVKEPNGDISREESDDSSDESSDEE